MKNINQDQIIQDIVNNLPKQTQDDLVKFDRFMTNLWYVVISVILIMGAISLCAFLPNEQVSMISDRVILPWER